MEFQSLNLGRSEIGGFPEEGLVGFFFFFVERSRIGCFFSLPLLCIGLWVRVGSPRL